MFIKSQSVVVITKPEVYKWNTLGKQQQQQHQKEIFGTNKAYSLGFFLNSYS